MLILLYVICWSVGIGRRARLKIWCQKWRVGSSPTTSTIMNNIIVIKQKKYKITKTVYNFNNTVKIIILLKYITKKVEKI